MPRSGPGPVIGRPRRSASPVVGGKRPATMLRIVLFPQPEGPRKTRNSPTPGSSRTARLMSWTAWNVLPSGLTKVLERFFSSRTFGLSPSVAAISGSALPREQLLVRDPDHPVRHHADEEDHQHAGEDLVHVRPLAGDGDDVAEAEPGVDDLGQDHVGPADPVHHAQGLPDGGQAPRHEHMANE